MNEQFKRKRQRDQIREEKIQYFTNELKTNNNITPGQFLEAMSNKDILPVSGNFMNNENNCIDTESAFSVYILQRATHEQSHCNVLVKHISHTPTQPQSYAKQCNLIE